jgi:outer membrane lipoprotein
MVISTCGFAHRNSDVPCYTTSMRMRNTAGGAVLCVMLMMLASCSPPFPREVLDRVDRTVTYENFRMEPERFTGRFLMFGGIIVNTRNMKDGTHLEVLQQPLDSGGRPEEGDETGGRFLIITPQFLDTAVFHRGRAVTVVGEGDGEEMQPLGQIEYTYPVIRAKALHLWPPPSGPRFSIGIGVYHGF